MESEYVTCSIATQEAIWLKRFLRDLNLTLEVDGPVELCYNTTAIQFAKDPKFHRKTKHIKRCYRFVGNVGDCD